jgi:predicted phosphate transport protein (TIGR00153 family)
VGFRFRPVDASFYDLFADQARHLVIGANLLADMLADGADREDIARQMRDAEHGADEATHAIVKRVNSTFVTPFDREDIYALASGLDDVMDEMDEAVDLILLYGVQTLPAEMSEQVEVLQRCAEITAAAMPKLQSSMQDMGDFWIEINRLENAGDRTHRTILAGLFDGQTEALEVIKLKDIADVLEGAIDAFEKVANTVEQIAVKES